MNESSGPAAPSSPPPWQHDHTFGQEVKKPGELRTLFVVVLTAATMVLEIVAGSIYGSMALLADGLHMASHALALAISMVAYVYARQHARDARYSFGTGKVNSLAGFAGAVLLAMFALLMVWESVTRLIHPIEIGFDQALFVAFIGLLVNGISVVVLGHEGSHNHTPPHDDENSPEAHHEHHDHNLRSAYLHVLADALTSVLAIFALLAGKYAGLHWMDPAMGVVGAVLVARWSVGLLKTTSRVLLDRQGPEHVCKAIRESIEQHEADQVVDLHLWPIGPGRYALLLTIASHCPKSPNHYRMLLPKGLHIEHVTVEVWNSDQTA